ncbi:MAG: short chain dehydrogenase [Chitinophagales bacterium]|nr:MAG: short chain dehydrogenase [Chitinophagales bacterium]
MSFYTLTNRLTKGFSNTVFHKDKEFLFFRFRTIRGRDMQLNLTNKYNGKRAFITGGGGALGRAFALLLARDGWSIGLTDISTNHLDVARKEITEAGGKCLTYVCDVSDKVAYKQAFDSFIKECQGIDLLINNAGVGDGGLFGEYELEKWDWITGINQMGVIYGTHYAVEVMKKQRSGCILIISSLAAVACMPNMSMYNVTKAAVLALGESIYAELRPFNIHVAVALPEFFKSGIMQHARGDENAATIGRKKIEKASITADEVAAYILHQTGKEAFYILHPLKARIAFRLIRWFPGIFLNSKFRQFIKKKWVRERLAKP